MFTPNVRFHRVLSALSMLALLVLPIDGALAGAPLKGVDVKLGKAPGGTPFARTTTDANGAFAFPQLPAGSYVLTFDLPVEAPPAPGAAAMRKSPSAVNVKQARIEVTGGGSTVVGFWDFERGTAFDPRRDVTAKATSASSRINVELKGPGGLTGICEAAIVKSKSNITNN